MASRLRHMCISVQAACMSVSLCVRMCLYNILALISTKVLQWLYKKYFNFTYDTSMGTKLWSIRITCKHLFPTCSFFGVVFLLLSETVRREVIDISDPIERVQFINKILEKDETQPPVGMSKFYNSLVTNHSKSQLTAV